MSELLNLVGMATGILLYAMLLAMVVGARQPEPRASGADPLLLATALLGLLWNVCALPAYELPKLGVLGALPALTAAGFAAMGYLPAVAVHSVLRGEEGASGRWLRRAVIGVAYAAGSLAAMLHGRALLLGLQVPSVAALQLLTYTFIALVLPLAAMTRRQPGSRRALWAAALAIFAVSALHLSQFERGDQSWPVELVGHHASLPLAFAILYQDYPFALADLFLKRALTLLAVVTCAFLGVAAIGTAPSIGDPHLGEAQRIGLLVTLCVAVAFSYSSVRRLAEWFVDTIVLRRPDYASLELRIAAAIQIREDVAQVLDVACDALAPALSAQSVFWTEQAPQTTSDKWTRSEASPRAAAAVVDVQVAESPRYCLHVANLTGGRRLLSDDDAALHAIAGMLARRIDVIRMTRERHEREMREQAIAKLATEAELRALRAQINPHFLFNALTTIGYLIQTAPPRALNTLMRLTALLRGVLRSDGEFTTLGRELALIEAYLDIEHARFEERLRVQVDVPDSVRDLQIPPLLLQPLVENAVRHGIAPARRGGDISIRARLRPTEPSALEIVVSDTGVGASPEQFRRGRRVGVGLKNVEERLSCHFGDRASLAVTSAEGTGTRVEIRMPATSGAAHTLAAEAAR